AFPCGPSNNVWIGIVQVTVLANVPDFADVSVSTSGVPPPDGVNVNVVLNAVGMNTDVLLRTWAGVNSPLPMTTTSTLTCWGPQSAYNCVEFFALTGSAPATGAITAAASNAAAAATNTCLVIFSPLS